jgi:hypothetical protein
MELIRKRELVAWDLRMRMTLDQEVVVLLEDTAAVPRLRGYVTFVGAAGGMALIDDPAFPEPTCAPLELIRSVRRPHFHEDKPLSWTRDRARRRGQEDAPLPGQLRLGGEPPEVSPRSRAAVLRAAGLLLESDLMGVLGALDGAVRGKRSCSTAAVAERLGRSTQWTVLRLARLAEMRLVYAETEDGRYEWNPGE